MAKQDRQPGLGATEAEARGPIRVLLVKERNFWGRPSETSIAAEAAMGETPGISPTVLETQDSTLDALDLLREAKREGNPFEVVLSGFDLKDSPVGGLQIADAVRDEDLARYFVLFNEGIPHLEPDYAQRKGINDVLSYPGTAEVTEALVQAKSAVLLAPSAPQAV